MSDAESHVYDTNFYDYIEQGSRASARVFIALLQGNIEFSSVLDVGCGRGAWLSEWKAAGFTDLTGVDGDYVVREDFHIPADEGFRPHDLTQPFNLGRRYDIAQCLEVAEHLPEAASDTLIESITRHADIVVFSAAQRGQGGESHINEQPLGYWRARFAKAGYTPFDFLRPLLKDETEVMSWYKYNTIVYVNDAGLARLSETVLASRVPDKARLAAGGSLSWRIRRAIVGLLPRAAVDKIAMMNAKRVANSR